MATQQKAYAEVKMGELLELETSVLRTLCLTVNTAGSELKYKILDTLSSADFYFPVNASIFEHREEHRVTTRGTRGRNPKVSFRFTQMENVCRISEHG